MRFERAAASLAGTLADLPVALRQDAKEGVVPLRAIRIRSRLDVHAVRVQVRRVRAMRHVCRTGQATGVHERRWNVIKELVEVFEDPRRRRGTFQTLGLRHGAERGLEIGGRNLERIRRRTFRHLSVIRAEHVSQLHAQNRIATRANRRPRACAVETVEGGVAVARRDRARQMAVSHDLQRQRLSRPLLRPPDPWLRPVFYEHRRGIRDGIHGGRLRRARALSRSRRLKPFAGGCRTGCTERRQTSRTNLQQFAPREHTRRGGLVVVYQVVSPEVREL